MTTTAVLIAVLCVSAAGNAVLGAAAYLQARTVSDLLRTLPEYRERATGGTARIYSRWNALQHPERREEADNK